MNGGNVFVSSEEQGRTNHTNNKREKMIARKSQGNLCNAGTSKSKATNVNVHGGEHGELSSWCKICRVSLVWVWILLRDRTAGRGKPIAFARLWRRRTTPNTEACEPGEPTTRFRSISITAIYIFFILPALADPAADNARLANDVFQHIAECDDANQSTLFALRSTVCGSVFSSYTRSVPVSAFRFGISLHNDQPVNSALSDEK